MTPKGYSSKSNLPINSGMYFSVVNALVVCINNGLYMHGQRLAVPWCRWIEWNSYVEILTNVYVCCSTV